MTVSRLQVWTLACRPKTLWAAIAPVILGTAMAQADQALHWPSAFAALFGAVMIQIGTNFANDYFDFKKGTDTHERIGPLRVTQAGLVRPAIMKRAIIIAFGLAAVAGLYLIWRGGMPILIIGLLSILFGVLYTAGPAPLGYHGLGEIFVLIFFGPVAVAGTHYVQAQSMRFEAMIAGMAPGLLSVAILCVNNLRDLETDSRTGKKTLAARFGRQFARVEYTGSVLVAGMIPVVLVLLTGHHSWALLSLLALIPAIPVLKTVWTQTDGPVLNEALAATGKLLLLHSVLFSVGWLL